jgi:flavin reductase (DIM6/NTAB) family NADH-FMN oxidoreductase RutF
VCRRFAISGGDKFAGVLWHPAVTGGAPVIDGSLAWVNCAVELIHDAGDHELVIGRVLDLGLGDGLPLLFYNSAFASLVEAAPDPAPLTARQPAPHTTTEKDGT